MFYALYGGNIIDVHLKIWKVWGFSCQQIFLVPYLIGCAHWVLRIVIRLWCFQSHCLFVPHSFFVILYASACPLYIRWSSFNKIILNYLKKKRRQIFVKRERFLNNQVDFTWILKSVSASTVTFISLRSGFNLTYQNCLIWLIVKLTWFDPVLAPSPGYCL